MKGENMSDDKYKLVQLGENGHFVCQSTEDPKLYICPICKANNKEIPLQRYHDNYICNPCDNWFRSDPDTDPDETP